MVPLPPAAPQPQPAPQTSPSPDPIPLPPAPPTPATTLPRPFLLLWGGQLISSLGTQGSLYGLGLWLLQHQGRLGGLAAVAVAVQLAQVAVLPLLGRWLPRWPVRWVLLGANGLGALSTLALALVLLVGPSPQASPASAVPLAPLLPLLALSAAATATLMLRVSTLIPALVRPRHLAAANGLFVSSDTGVAMVAPFLGATVVAYGGLAGILAIDCGSFLVALAAAALVPLPHRVGLHPGPSQATPPRRGLRHQLQHLAGQARERSLLLQGGALALALAATELLFPAWVLASLGPERLSLALLAGLAGYLMGLQVWSRQPPQRWLPLLLTALTCQSLTLMGAGLVVFEQQPLIWLLGIMVFTAGVPISLAAVQGLWQQRTPLEEQPTVFAARYAVEWSARLAGTVLAALLVDQLIRPALRWPWPAWLLEALGSGAGRPMAIGLGATGWVLLLLTVAAAPALKRG